MTPSNPTKPKFIGDPLNATYRWELYLTNGKIFDGYSKAKGMDEKKDKQALLQDCIARLLNNGYLDKCYQMFFYERGDSHRSQDQLILEMYPHGCKPHASLELDLSTCNFLDRIYDARRTGQGKNFKELLPPRVSNREQEKIDFAYSKARFPTQGDLHTYCVNVMLKKYARPRVEAWYEACKINYTQALTSATAPAPQPDVYNQQAAAAAQRTIQGLHNKFSSNR